jgi:hypothetical protein
MSATLTLASLRNSESKLAIFDLSKAVVPGQELSQPPMVWLGT